jgi:hypothetical protein
MKAARRKYLFRSRLEAEEAYRAKERTLSLCLDLLCDQAARAPHVYEAPVSDSPDRCRAECYRLDGASGGRMFLSWRDESSRATSVQPWYVEDFLAEYRDHRCGSSALAALRQLAQQIDHARRRLCAAPESSPAGVAS